MIAPLEGLVIILTITELSTQPGKDFVRVWQCADIACSQPLQLAELSGLYSSPQVVTSTTGFMKVVFTSDASLNYDGFTASWTSVCSYLACHEHCILDLRELEHYTRTATVPDKLLLLWYAAPKLLMLRMRRGMWPFHYSDWHTLRWFRTFWILKWCKL
jgi:hypothetical protein